MAFGGALRVVNPAISLEQLFEEFARLQDEKNREAVRDQILVKMRHRISRLHEQARARYEAEAGETPEATLKRLTEDPTATVAAWVKQRPGLGRILDWDPDGGAPALIPISHHPDQVVSPAMGMNPGRLQQVEDLYHSAREHDTGQRGAFLAEACCGGEELRREVESLLAQNVAGDVMERPALEVAAGLLAGETVTQLAVGAAIRL
jgi:hypothetical protein